MGLSGMQNGGDTKSIQRFRMTWEIDGMGIDQCSEVGFGISSSGLMGCIVYVFNYFVKATEKWRYKKLHNSSGNISD